MRNLIIIAPLVALSVTLAVSEPAGARTIVLDLSGWHFVSFQSQPDLDSPEDVFGTAGYDHIWGFDPEIGWLHYSPREESLLNEHGLNDLQRIEAFRGYWVHVTDPGGLMIEYGGETPQTQELFGAGWHAVGIFGSPGAPADAFPVLRLPTMPDNPLIAEIWRFDGDDPIEGAKFSQVYAAGDDPEECNPANGCLEEGVGYWMRTTGTVSEGQEFSVSRDCIVISGGRGKARIDVSFKGVGPAAAMLHSKNVCAMRSQGAACEGGLTRCCSLDWDVECSSDADCENGTPALPLSLLPAHAMRVGDREFPDLAPGGGEPHGPDPGIPGCGNCQGEAGCADICFASSTSSTAGRPGEYSVYATLSSDELMKLGATGAFSSCREPLTTLVLEEFPATAPGNSRIAAVINVAVQPPIVAGEYSGFLSYNARDRSVPLRLLIDNCVSLPGDGTRVRNCSSSRLTAIINPKIRTSNLNAIDDDRDGEIDEPDEAGDMGLGKPVLLRQVPSFPAETILHGTLSNDQMALDLSGIGSILPLPFVQDLQNDPDLGIAKLFAGTSRQLHLEGYQQEPGVFTGIFSEEYKKDPSDEEGSRQTGVFSLSRVRGPECVSATNGQTRSLGVPCEDKYDCPRRCVYSGVSESAQPGFPCRSYQDCPSICLDAEQRVSECATGDKRYDVPHDETGCAPFECRFYDLFSDEPSWHERAPVAIDFTPPSDPDAIAIVEIEGTGPDAVLLVPLGSGATSCVDDADCASPLICDDGFCTPSFGDLPCGLYWVRITIEGCGSLVREVDWCGGDDFRFEDQDLDDLECPAGVCKQGRSSCSADGDCIGLCEEGGADCTSNTDCPLSHVGICSATEAPCSTENPCPSHNVCLFPKTHCIDQECIPLPTKLCDSDNSICEEDTDCGRRCLWDGEPCSSGLDCVRSIPGRCQISNSECLSDSDCPPIIIPGPFDDIEINSFCIDAREERSNCVSASCVAIPSLPKARNGFLASASGLIRLNGIVQSAVADQCLATPILRSCSESDPCPDSASCEGGYCSVGYDSDACPAARDPQSGGVAGMQFLAGLNRRLEFSNRLGTLDGVEVLRTDFLVPAGLRTQQ